MTPQLLDPATVLVLLIGLLLAARLALPMIAALRHVRACGGWQQASRLERWQMMQAEQRRGDD